MPDSMEDPKVLSSQWRELDFEPACDKWLESRRGNVSAKTLHEYELNVKTLAKFFKPYKLSEITSESIQEYQKKRQGEGVGASGINHETSVLQQLLKYGGLWQEIRQFFHPIKKKRWQPGRVISQTEKARLLRHAESNPGWASSYYFAAISVNTTCGPGEIKCLRLRDVELEPRSRAMFRVCEGAKNDERVRPISLVSDEAYEAMAKAVERARSLGASEGDHYIFPFRDKKTKQYDATKHQTEFKWSWKKMCKAAGLDGLKPYDLRRTKITDMLMDPMIPDEVIIKVAGHVGKDMLKHYSYLRMDAQRKALARGNKKSRSKLAPPKKPSPVNGTHAVAVPAEASPEVKQQLGALIQLLSKALGVSA